MQISGGISITGGVSLTPPDSGGSGDSVPSGPTFWDSSGWSASYSSSTYIVDTLSRRNSVTVKPDGTKLWVGGDQYGNQLEEFTMSTAFDLSTISKTATCNLSEGINAGYWNSDGTKMFSMYNGKFVQWGMSAAWDVTTMSKDYEVNDPHPYGSTWVALSWNGEHAYFITYGSPANEFTAENNNGSTVQADLSAGAWDLSSGLTNISSITNGFSSGRATASCALSPDGYYFYVFGGTGGLGATRTKLDTQYDITSADFTTRTTISSTYPGGIRYYILENGQNMFNITDLGGAGEGDDYITHFSL